MKQLRSRHLSALKVISEPMSALARTSERDCRTRTTDENCTANESWTRTKYLYDALGRRTTKSVGTAQTNYIYALNGNVISEADQNGTWMNVYLRMNGQFIAQYLIGSPRTQFILSDHLGSARVLTKYDGTFVDSLDFL